MRRRRPHDPIEQVAPVILRLPDGEESRGRITPGPYAAVILTADGDPVGRDAGSWISDGARLGEIEFSVDPSGLDAAELDVATDLLNQWRTSVDRAIQSAVSASAFHEQQEAERRRMLERTYTPPPKCGHRKVFPNGKVAVCGAEPGHNKWEKWHRTQAIVYGRGTVNVMWDDDGNAPPDWRSVTTPTPKSPTQRACGHVSKLYRRRCTRVAGHEGQHYATMFAKGAEIEMTWGDDEGWWPAGSGPKGTEK